MINNKWVQIVNLDFGSKWARIDFSSNYGLIEVAFQRKKQVKKKYTQQPSDKRFYLVTENSTTNCYATKSVCVRLPEAYFEACLNWWDLYRDYFESDRHRDYLISQHPTTQKRIHEYMTRKANLKKKVQFCRIIDTERGQLLLVIKPLINGAQISAVTLAGDQLANKNSLHASFVDAQKYVMMIDSRRALNTIAELNGEPYDYGIYYPDQH